MNIETLQIKRVTGNWDTHKSYIPYDGEMVEIALKDYRGFTFSNLIPETPGGSIRSSYFGASSSPIIVIGDGNSSLDTLVNNLIIDEGGSNIFMGYRQIVDLISNNLMMKTPSSAVPHAIPCDNGNAPVNSDLIGSSAMFARADHTHYLSRANVEQTLNTNQGINTKFFCRRIKAGTSDPTATGTDVGGEVGDIYIRYE